MVEIYKIGDAQPEAEIYPIGPAGPTMANASEARKAGPDTVARQLEMPEATLVEAMRQNKLLTERKQQVRDYQQQNNMITGPGAAVVGFAEQLADAGMAAPSEALSAATYYPRRLYNTMTKGIVEGNSDTKLFGAVPRLSTEKMTGMLGGEDALLGREVMREDYPTWTSAGEVGGLAAGVMSLKAPFSRSIRAGEVKAARGIERAEQNVEKMSGKALSKKQAQQMRLKNRPLKKRFERWAGRTVESTMEGVAAAALAEGDPVVTGAVAGGMQAGNTLLGSLAHIPLVKKGGVFTDLGRFGLQTFIMGRLIQAYSEMTPGEDLKDYEATERGIKKYLMAYGAGLVTTVLNGRKVSGSLAQRVPGTVQAFTSMPRQTLTAAVAKWTELPPEEQQELAPKLQSFADGSALENASPEVARQWDKAVNKGADAIWDFIKKYD